MSQIIHNLFLSKICNRVFEKICDILTNSPNERVEILKQFTTKDTSQIISEFANIKDELKTNLKITSKLSSWFLFIY